MALTTDALTYDAFAVAAPGLAPIVAGELSALGIAPRAVGSAGVEFAATATELYRANLWLRTATRVVVRIAQFRVVTFAELERLARKVEWGRFVAPDAAVEVRTTCHKSKLYHSDAVSQRILRVIGAPAAGPEDVDGQLLLARLDHDVCTISIDSSGELLHRRGYRLETAKAPLRETLAAAAIIGSGWDGTTPFMDPLCGSGTIAIEAALLARGRPPGLGRAFGFMGWPSFERAAWERVLASVVVRAGEVPPIVASDRDAGATSATIANAERAGVGGDILVRTCAISAIEPPGRPGWLVTNPPYGERIGDAAALRDLYARFGQVVRATCPGWAVGMLAADLRLTRQTRLGLTPRWRTTNGGIPITLVVGSVH